MSLSLQPSYHRLLSIWWEIWPSILLIHIFLVLGKTENLYSYLPDLCISFFSGNYLFRTFAHFNIGLFIFLLIICGEENAFPVTDLKHFASIYFDNTFLSKRVNINVLLLLILFFHQCLNLQSFWNLHISFCDGVYLPSSFAFPVAVSPELLKEWPLGRPGAAIAGLKGCVFPMMLLCDRRDWELDIVGNTGHRSIIFKRCKYPLSNLLKMFILIGQCYIGQVGREDVFFRVKTSLYYIMCEPRKA